MTKQEKKEKNKEYFRVNLDKKYIWKVKKLQILLEVKENKDLVEYLIDEKLNELGGMV